MATLDMNVSSIVMNLPYACACTLGVRVELHIHDCVGWYDLPQPVFRHSRKSISHTPPLLWSGGKERETVANTIFFNTYTFSSMEF